MSVAVPTDYDDDDGGAARRGAADARIGYRGGIAPAARLFHGRRPSSQPGADAVHDACDLPVSGANQLLVIKSVALANTGFGRCVGAAATRTASPSCGRLTASFRRASVAMGDPFDRCHGSDLPSIAAGGVIRSDG